MISQPLPFDAPCEGDSQTKKPFPHIPGASVRMDVQATGGGVFESRDPNVWSLLFSVGLFQDPGEHIDTETNIDGPGGSGRREGGMCHIEAGPDGEFGKTFQGLHEVHDPVELEIGRNACLIAESGDLIRFFVRIARMGGIVDETDPNPGKRSDFPPLRIENRISE